jgi:hypothetical protein
VTVREAPGARDAGAYALIFAPVRAPALLVALFGRRWLRRRFAAIVARFAG